MVALTPVSFRVGLRRGGVFVLDEAFRDLLKNLCLVLRLRTQIAGVIPLELRFELAADFPVGVAEMVIDDRVRGLEVDRALQLLNRLVVAAKLVIGPSETVHDVTVRRA